MGLRVSIFLLVLCGPSAVLAQSAADLPSVALQPSLDVVKQAVGLVKTDKWKGAAAVRSEADANLASIQRDVQTTLPALLATADAAPDSAAKLLPAYRNIEALYDVLLRVDTAGRLSAPSDQSSALDQALMRLEEGRRGLGDRLQADAVAGEKRTSDLQAALKAVPPPPPPPVPVVCPSPTVKKKVAAKPATAKPAGSSTPAK